MQAPPHNPEDQLKWLVDRAALTDLMVELTRALDTKEFQRAADLFVDDGFVDLPFARLEKHEMASRSEEILSRYSRLQHQICNPGIDIDGDQASMRFNLEAVHVHGVPDHLGSAEFGTLGGVYEAKARRQPEGWRLEILKPVVSWQLGTGFPGT